MQITHIKDEGLNLEIQISIPSNIIDKKIQQELLNIKKEVKLPGFRPGMVPDSLIKKKYTLSARQEVTSHEIRHAISDIIKERKLNLVGDPKIEDLQNEENKDLNFVVKFEKFPDITMPDFKKIKITKPILKIEEKEVDAQLQKLADLNKKFEKESKAKIKKGDQVTLDAVGYTDEKAFEGGTLKDHKLVIGSGAFIAGFEDQLIGAKTGDEVEVNVVFPEEYHSKELEGKPAKFVVNVKAVHSATPVVIDDEFAKTFEAQSLEELRSRMSKHLESEFSEQVNAVMKMHLFTQLEDALNFEVPTSLLTQEQNILEVEAKKNENEESVFKGKSQEEITQYYNKLALRRVRTGLMLAEYVKIKNLRVEPADLQSLIMSQARNFPGQEQMLFDFYNKNPKALERLKGPALEAKAVQHIFDHEIELVKKDYSKKDLEKFLEKEEDNAILI